MYSLLHRVSSLVVIFTLLSSHSVPFFHFLPTVYAADDGLPAVLQSLTSSTANGSYTTGAAIDITANFDEPVDGSSAMTVTLDTGIQVNLSGDGDTSMSGTYTVGTGENSVDLTISSINSASVTTVDDTPTGITETNYSIPSGQNLGDNSHLVINTSCNAIVGIQDEPIFSVSIRDKVYIGNQSSDSVSVINGVTNSIITTISVGDSPSFFVSVGDKIYVANIASNNVSVINSVTDAVIATVTVGSAPNYMTVHNGEIYVMNSSSNNVSVINSVTDAVIATVTVGSAPNFASFSNGNIYVSNINSDSVSVIDTVNNTVSQTIPVGDNPNFSFGIDNKVYVSNQLSDTISVIDTFTNTVVTTIVAGDFPGYYYPFGDKIFVTNLFGDNVSVIDKNTDTIVDTITVGDFPYYGAIFNNKFYVLNQASDNISVIDAITNTVIATLSVGDFPNFGSLSSGKLFIGDRLSNTISVVDTNLDTVINVCAPSLTSLTSLTPNGNYTTGQSINLKAQFNEALGANSTMDVTLNTGDVVTLTHASPGDAFLTGTYTIGSGDTAIDLTATDISNVSVSDTDTTPNTVTNLSVFLSPDLSNDTPRNLGDLKNISVGGGVCSIAVGTNPYQMVTVGTLAYVANMGSDDISVINTSTNTVIDTIDIGDGPYGVTYNSTAQELYVANIFSDDVFVIDLNSANTGTYHTVTHTIDVGIQPYYATSLGTKVYVTNNVSNSVSVINTSTHAVTNTISVGTAPRGIRVHGTDLYVANYGSGSYGSVPTAAGTISVIDSTTNTVTDTITVGVGPRGVTVLGDEVYVANFEDDTVSVIDTGTNIVTHTISVGNTPRGITASNGNIYVENYQDGTISKINPSTHAVTGTYAVGNTPAGFTTVGTDLYISRFTDNLVSIFDTTTNTMRSICSSDTTAPTFSMQIYSDSGLTTTVSDNASIGAGTYYVSVTANETLSAALTISIVAQGTANDVTNATMTSVSGNQYKYAYVVTTDAAASGSVLLDFSVTGTDSASNTATNVNPTNETTKTIYIDTIAPSAPSAFTATVIGNSTSADLAWTNPVADFASVTIRRSTSAYPTTITDGSAVTGGTNITGTSLADSGLTHGTYYYSIFAKDIVGNISTSANITAMIDTIAPIISTVTPVTTPATDMTPDYTFTTDEAGTITYGGSCSSVTTSAILGNNTITLNTLTPGTYTNCTIIVTDAATNASTTLTIPSFTIAPVSTGGGGFTTPLTGNQFCTGTLPTGATVIQTGYSAQSYPWRHDSSPTGPYQWCSFKCPTNTQYNSPSNTCIPVSVIAPPLFTPPSSLPIITPVLPTLPSYLLPTPTRPFWKSWKIKSLTLNSAENEAIGTTTETTTNTTKMTNNTGFFYPSEDTSFFTKLQSTHPDVNITEETYMNQCVTKQTKPYYRKCSLGFDLDTFGLFRDDVLCEGFIVPQVSENDYRFQGTAPRKEVVGIVVKMKKQQGESVSFVLSGEYQNIYDDIGKGEAFWIQPVVETALKYGIISAERKTFEPDRDVTRAEAYAMVMKSVCMDTTLQADISWQQNIFNLAKKDGFTGKTWETFESERPILRQELFLLASKVSDWAERTGGCDPKPAWCFAK